MNQTALAFGLMSYRFPYPYDSDLSSPPLFLGTSRAVWQTARDAARDNIAYALWPVFDRAKPVSKQAEALNEADFHILRAIRPPNDHWFRSEASISTRGVAFVRTLFRCEDSVYEAIRFRDDNNKLVTCNTSFSSFAYYVGFEATEDDFARLQAPIQGKTGEAGLVADRFGAADWLNLSLKHIFQRPRPYQLAFERGNLAFEHELSQTAHSPALPSGHALQAAAFALFAHDDLAADEVWGRHVGHLPAWAASMGDRRNCAGLHYPSDNWASWIVLATVLGLLFPDAARRTKARARLAENICSSVCYRLGKGYPEFSRAKITLGTLGIEV